jgi:SAM-dependent methyltransferase
MSGQGNLHFTPGVAPTRTPPGIYSFEVFACYDQLVPWPVDLRSDPTLQHSFDILRSKWGEVPGGNERVLTSHLLRLSDSAVLAAWDRAYIESSTGEAFSVRGWYQEIYKDVFRGKKILDVGCGMGPDTIFFAAHGAAVWFSDIIPDNVEYVRRICRLKQLSNANFLYISDLTSLDRLPRDFDAIYCCGSLLTAPFEVTRNEVQALLQHLPIGGRWIELAYPQKRWEREGRLPFNEWGAKTDGGAPWIEWKDVAKVRGLWEPATFEVILDLEFHDADFNWFDLVRRS